MKLSLERSGQEYGANAKDLFSHENYEFSDYGAVEITAVNSWTFIA